MFLELNDNCGSFINLHKIISVEFYEDKYNQYTNAKSICIVILFGDSGKTPMQFYYYTDVTTMLNDKHRIKNALGL